jgi:hypothetical protein
VVDGAIDTLADGSRAALREQLDVEVARQHALAAV